MSPCRAEARAEDARSALTRGPSRSYPWWSPSIRPQPTHTCFRRATEVGLSMRLSGFEALHADGYDETAWVRFAQMCREALYDGLPADVSHLVHYTTLGTLTSMLGVVEAADDKCRLATRVHRGAAEARGGGVG